MTDQTPTPPPPPPPPPPADTVTAATVTAPTAEPAAAGGGSGGRKAIIGGVVAALVLGGGYGAYAVYDKLDGGGPQPHDVLPASTQLYLRLDLDPSAGQKVDLFKLLRKVPDLADEVGITSDKADIRELVFRDVVADECEDVDYDRDVEPWLGDRVGVGANIEDESFLIAVQTTDEDASRAGIKKLFACADESYGIAYLDGYAIIAPEQDDVDRAVTATEKGSLGDKKAFISDFEDLGNQGVASGWADLSSLADIPEVKDALGTEIDQITDAGSIATTLRTDGSAIELAVLGAPSGLTGGDAKATSLGKLPADTVAALSFAGLGDGISKNFDSLVEDFDSGFSGGDTTDEFGGSDDLGGLGLDDELGDDFGSPGSFGAQSFIDEIEQATGFQLPEDLATLFGDSITLAVGADNLETIPTLSGPEDFSALNIALSLTSDKTKALDLVQRIATLASDAGVPLVAGPTDDGAVLATNQGAADAIADPDGSLGDDKVFRSVIPDGDSAYGGLYVNVGTVIDKLLAADPPDDVRQDIESASAFSAFGISASPQGDDRSLLRLRVAFK